MMMKATPTASFIMVEPEFLLEVLVIALNSPPQLGHVDQIDQGGRGRQGREPLPSIGFHRKIRQKSLENTIYGVCAAERPNIVLKCPCIQLGSCHVAHTAYMGIFRHSHSILCVARAVGNLMDGKVESQYLPGSLSPSGHSISSHSSGCGSLRQ